ncbi:MAG: HpcH/HpaI aldolase family protein [Chloroflexota bacterium]
MRANTAKEKIQAGGFIMGPIIGFESPQLVEMAGLAGFDFAYIDCEHGAMGPQGCENMVRAADAVGVPTIVRVPSKSPHVISRYLDTGVSGVQVPHVNNREEALAAVAAAKYPPLGQRSIGGGRCADYRIGSGSDAEYTARANEQTLLAIMIEDVAAIPHLDAMLAVEGIDVFVIGPADLAASLGLVAQRDDPRVQAAFDQIIGKVTAAGKVVGLNAASPRGVKANVARGARYVTLSMTALIAQMCVDFVRGVREG